MSTFILVHGGWAASWVWERVTPLLQAEGHHVVTPDLPGHGADPTPPQQVTLDRYVGPVVRLLDAAPEPVVLVGHSSGGVVITQAAERRPEKIQRLVYLCAYLPRDGQSLFELGQTDPDQLILPNLVVSPDGSTARIRPEVLNDALFADCSEEDLRRFAERIGDQPLAPAATAVTLTPERYGRVPKAYLECLADRGISPALQRRMHQAAGIETVISLDTGHMPMYAAPDTLASQLSKLAG